MTGGTVYILASKRGGTLYIGVTIDLKLLVWYEHHPRIEDAIQREKNVKHWVRKWKVALIEKTNPQWRDLYPEMLVEFGFAPPAG